MVSKKQRMTEPQTLEIHGLSHDGRGVAKANDKTVFVFGALPEEIVETQIVRTHRRFDEGKALQIQNPSPDRVTPRCEHFGVCGGCQLQHLSTEQQIHQKQALVAEQLTHQAKVQPKTWLPPLVGPHWGYRQKARLSVKLIHKKETVAVGFREQKNSKIALLEHCDILDPRVGSQIQALRSLIQSLDSAEQIAQIEVATTPTQVALVFRHLVPLSDKDVTALTNFCEARGFSLYLQSGGVDTVIPVSEATQELTYTLPNQDLTYAFHPLDFTQVNQQMNQQMIDQALQLLDVQSDDSVLDLFCGLGNFSLPIAQKAAQVVGVEGSAAMVEKAMKNAQRNRLDNAKFLAYDLNLSQRSTPWAQDQFDKIVLDPPRCGAEMVVSEIQHFGAKHILYVSCNPATFCRDAAELVHNKGYELDALGVMDMFPHTAHVEVMGLFKLKT